MNLKNINELTKSLKKKRHPAQYLGEFLLQHSNSPDYLVAALRAFLKAAEQDFLAEKEMLNQLIYFAIEDNQNE